MQAVSFAAGGVVAVVDVVVSDVVVAVVDAVVSEWRCTVHLAFRNLLRDEGERDIESRTCPRQLKAISFPEQNICQHRARSSMLDVL